MTPDPFRQRYGDKQPADGADQMSERNRYEVARIDEQRRTGHQFEKDLGHEAAQRQPRKAGSAGAAKP